MKRKTFHVTLETGDDEMEWTAESLAVALRTLNFGVHEVSENEMRVEEACTCLRPHYHR